MRGETAFGGIFPVILAGPPKHAAIPTDPVIVGVMKNRKKFVGAHVPSFPPALFDQHIGPGMKACFLTGKILGRQQGDFPQVVWFPVSALNTGYPVSGVSDHIGFPNTTGADPGASGAQFIGSERQLPPPNQHQSPWTIVSSAELILSMLSSDIPPRSMVPLMPVAFRLRFPPGLKEKSFSPAGSWLSGIPAAVSMRSACVPARLK